MDFPSSKLWYAAMLCFLFASTPAAAESWIDLQVESVKVNPVRSAQNQKVEIVTAVRNNGSRPAENIYLRIEIYEGKKRLKTIQEIPVVARLPRSGVSQALPVVIENLSAGSYRAVVTVDPEQQIVESNEDNNEREIDFTMGPLANAY